MRPTPTPPVYGPGNREFRGSQCVLLTLILTIGELSPKIENGHGLGMMSFPVDCIEPTSEGYP